MEIKKPKLILFYGDNMISDQGNSYIIKNKVEAIITDYGFEFEINDISNIDHLSIDENDFILGIGDTASVKIFKQSDKLKNWASILSSTNFDSNVEYNIPKFWVSPYYEISLLINYLETLKEKHSGVNNSFVCEEIPSTENEFIKNYVNIFKLIAGQFNIQLNLQNSNFNFIPGLGDSSHADRLKSHNNSSCILTNNAVTLIEESEKLKGLESKIFYADFNVLDTERLKISNKNDSNISNKNIQNGIQYKIIEIALSMIKFLIDEKKITTPNIANELLNIRYFRTTIFRDSIGFDYNGYLSVPLIVKSLSNEVKFEPSILKEQDSYSIAEFVKKTNNEINKFRLTPFQVTFNPLKFSKIEESLEQISRNIIAAFEMSKVSYFISHSDKKLFLDFDGEIISENETLGFISNLLKELIDNNEVKPLQINLTEQDALDNDVLRILVVGHDNSFRTPIVYFKNENILKSKYIVVNNPFSLENLNKKYDTKSVLNYSDIITFSEKTIGKYIYIIPYGASSITNYSCLILNGNFKLRFPELQFLQVLTNQLFPIFHNEIANRENIIAATKSAKSAIMGRNMSHNLGSHVLYYLRQHLSGDITKMAELLKEFVFEKTDDKYIVKVNINNKPTQIGEINESQFNSIDLPFLKGLGTFLTYLQERQDYIAAISSDYKPSFGSVNFKSFIIDNFTKDLRAKRHGNSAKQEDNILLRYIAKSENTAIKIRYNGEDLSGDALDANSELHKFSVDVPGITLGRQAFYSILENVIRNAAKHGDLSGENKTLEINICIEKEKYNFTLKQSKQIDDEEKWKDDHFLVKISNNSKNQKGIADVLRKCLQEDLIDGTGALVENHKGLKEIVISALWLNGMNITEVTKEERLKYIDVVEEDGLDGNENYLTYRLFLKKSKKLLIVSDILISTEGKEEWKEYAVVASESFWKDIERASSYELVVDLTDKGLDFDENLTKESETKKIQLINSMRRYLRPDKIELIRQDLIDYFKLKETQIPTTSLDSTKDLNLNTLEKLYKIYYFWYIRKEFLLNEELPKFRIAFDTTSESSSGESPSQINKNETVFSSLFDTSAEDGDIVNIEDASGDYYNQVGGKEQDGKTKVIAFRRHIHNKLSEFFQGSNIDFSNEEASHYTTLLGKTAEKYISVETVTGDNSSFRVINNDIKDDIWVLRKIESAYAKVLIIDERLWDTNAYLIKKPGANSEDSKKKIENVLKPIFTEAAWKIAKEKIDWETGDKKYFENIIIKLWGEKPDKEVLTEIGICEIYNPINEEYLKNDENVIKYASGITNLLDDDWFAKAETKINSQRTMLNHLKNITIANVSIERNEIYDDFMNSLARIEFVNDNLSFKVTNKITYDFITIHQGIIDKLIEGEKLSKEDKEKQVKIIINSLRETFNAKKIVVHTGRGKPNYIQGIAPYRSLSDLDYSLNEPKEVMIDYFKTASYE